MLMAAAGAMADDYVDDIYYNPKKDSPEAKLEKRARENAARAYMADRGNMNVDEYNRRGEQYYYSPIDTVGTAAERGEDFVYTQEIQKYYNPTIVVENAEQLGDVLADSYGNVTIVINDDGYPCFGPAWSYPYNPYYYYGYNYGFCANPYLWGPSWSWSINWGWNNWGWGIDPWYAYGPAWGWGWGPGYGWGWGPSVGSNPHWTADHYRPRGNDRVGAGNGWGSRPASGTLAGNHRTGTTRRSNASGNYDYSSIGNSSSSSMRTSTGATRRTAGTGRIGTSTSTSRIGTSTSRTGTSTNRSVGTSRTSTPSSTYRQSSSGSTSRSSGSYRSSSSGGGNSRSGGFSSGGGSRSGGRR